MLGSCFAAVEVHLGQYQKNMGWELPIFVVGVGGGEKIGFIFAPSFLLKIEFFDVKMTLRAKRYYKWGRFPRVGLPI